MNALFVLMGLLVLSYLGSFLFSARSARGFGLPSGAEFVALGVVLGPQVLGVVQHQMLDSFEPIAHVAIAWFALVLGLDFGFAGEKRIRVKSFVLATLGTALTAAAVFGAVLAIAWRFPGGIAGAHPYLLAGALAAVAAETTQHAIRWVTERGKANGPLTSIVTELAHGDDAVPILIAATVFAFTASAAHVPRVVTPWEWLAITLALGVVLGGTAAVLIGQEFSLAATWGVLLGMTLLAIGVAVRFQLSPIATTFSIGVALATFSPHRLLVREVVVRTERPVLLPALLLAGARIDIHVFQASRVLIFMAVAALGARLLAKLVSGGLLAAFARDARRGGAGLGLGLMSSGALSIAIGLSLAIRFPGPVGDTALVAATAAAVLGEIIGPLSLRRALFRAGELEEPAPSSTSVPPVTSSEASS